MNNPELDPANWPTKHRRKSRAFKKPPSREFRFLVRKVWAGESVELKLPTIAGAHRIRRELHAMRLHMRELSPHDEDLPAAENCEICVREDEQTLADAPALRKASTNERPGILVLRPRGAALKSLLAANNIEIGLVPVERAPTAVVQDADENPMAAALRAAGFADEQK